MKNMSRGNKESDFHFRRIRFFHFLSKNGGDTGYEERNGCKGV